MWTLAAIGLFALVAVSRFAFATTHLYAWDSVLYARAIEDFAVDLDPLVARPHPPGYLFYVLAARAAAAVLGDANAGLVAVSAISSALACSVALVVGRRLFGTPAGILAAAVLATSPLMWQYGAVAYPYTLLAVLVGVIGPLLWWARDRSSRDRVLVSVALGLAAGFRQDLLLLLGPLWLYATWRSPRDAALATPGLGAACLGWLLPSALLSGGLPRYLDSVFRQWSGAAGTSVAADAAITAAGLWALLLLVMPFALVGAWRVSAAGPLRLFFALWTLPTLGLYLFVHAGIPGYVASLAVPLAIVAGGGAASLMGASQRPARLVAAAFALACLGNAWWFLTADVVSAAELERRDTALRARIDFIRTLSPDEAVIVASADRLHALYYLPQYPAVFVPSTGTAAPPFPRARVAVLFGDDLRPAETETAQAPLPDGVRLYLLQLDDDEVIEVSDGTVRRRPTR